VGQCCEQRLSRRTIVDARAILRAALTEAVSGRLISHNPAAAVRLPRARPRRMAAWTAEQARQFLASARADHDRLYPAYVLLLVLGLRRGELLALQWTDIDLDAATVHVHRELQRIDGRLILGETKTLDSDAGLPLPPLCVAVLTQLAQGRDQSCWHGTSDGGFVVATRTGTPVDPRNLYRSFQRRCAKAGVPRIPVHGTRHACASLLVELDTHPRVAMQILRHAKIATTMDIYTHIPTRATRTALGLLSQRLDSATEAADEGGDPRPAYNRPVDRVVLGVETDAGGVLHISEAPHSTLRPARCAVVSRR
jgi:integrase